MTSHAPRPHGPLEHRRRALVQAWAAALAAGWLPDGPRAQTLNPLSAIDPARRLSFPTDFGAHPQARTEWWYLTGELHPGGPAKAPGMPAPLGFQITFFRSRVDTVPAQHPSPLAAHQLLLAHVAVSDARAGRQWHEQRLGRQALGVAGAALGDTQVWLRDWRLERLPPSGGTDRYRAVAQTRDFSLALTLSTPDAPLKQGRDGFSQKGPLVTQASHYYSRPQLAVQGQVGWNGRAPVAMTGRAWLDHEWSEALLAPDAVGWDWVGMNLDDGGALTAFRLRRADGSALWAGGSHRSPQGVTRVFTDAEVRLTPGRVWTSPRTGARYPVQWQLDTPVGRFQVSAAFEAQELDGAATTASPVYWEGLSQLRSADGQRVLGGGYLEMTGYAGKLSL